MSLTVDDVYRDWNTRSVPSSGDYKPPKSDIRRLLKSILGGTAAIGDFEGTWDVDADYVTSAYVEHGGSLWVANRASTGVTPVEGADWSLLLPGVTAADGSVTFPKLAPAAVQTDVDVVPDDEADDQIPTVKRVGTLIEGTPLSDLSGNLPAERISGRQTWRSFATAGWDLNSDRTEVPSYRRQTGLIGADGLVYLTWSADCSHRGISAGSPAYDGQNMPPGTNYAIGLGGWIYYRRATTLGGLSSASFTVISNSIAAGQLANRSHHYQTIGGARVPFAVEAGYYYEFTIQMSAHTDAGTMNGVDGAAELTTGGGTNFLQVEYEPGATIEA